MTRSRVILSTLRFLVIMGAAGALFAQAPASAAGGGQGPGRGAGGARGGGQAPGARGAAPARGRMPLFFREEWKQNAAESEHPISQESVGNANLELKLYGGSAKEIQIAGSAANETNPIHPWTGLCTTPCGLALRDKNNFADLTGLSRIKWVTKMSGFHQVRPIIKLADGTLLVGDYADGSPVDWLEHEFSLSTVKWRRLDPERVVTVGDVVASPDLSKVDEIGFVDLLPGSGHGQGGWSDVAKFEVYARPVPRQ